MNQKQRRAIECLLTSSTRREAAQKAGVSESTLRSYFQNPAFVTAYNQAVSEILESTTRKAQRAAGEAVDVLKEIMLDTDAQAGSRVSAADKLLNHAARLTETTDIMSRLSELEQRANNSS